MGSVLLLMIIVMIMIMGMGMDMEGLVSGNRFVSCVIMLLRSGIGSTG